MLWWVLLALVLSIVHADIYFGQSCALTGGSSFLGTQLRLGILAAFNETNAKGGVNGQLLQLVSLDDAYDPLIAAPNTQILAQNASMFALIGYVGTATAVAALPIALNYSIPLVGSFTGTPSLRSPFQRSVINIRAGYYDETAAMVNYLVNKRQVRRISIMYQADSFGTAGYQGLTTAMTAINMKLQSEATYVRGTTVVEPAVAQIATGQPEAIVMIGTYAALSKFVILVKTNTTLYPNAANIIFLTVSFVGSEAFAQQLGNLYHNVIITQVVPNPGNKTFKVVRDYLKALDAASPGSASSYVSFEGYLIGSMVSMALRESYMQTRAGFLNTIYENEIFYLGGLVAGPYSDCNVDTQQYPPNSDVCGCNSGLRRIWTSTIQANNTFKDIDNTEYSWTGACFSNPSTSILEPIVFVQIIQNTTKAEFMRRGLLTAFLEFNARGGYNGRQLQLRTVYHEDIDATLLFQISALAADTTIGVIGMVNTTIIEYVKPLLLAKNIPLIGASTGSAQIHDTFNRLIINTRPSYNSEVGAIVNYLTNQLLHRRIGFVYRNISLGRGAYNSFKTVMSSLGLTPHSVNMYVDDLTIACSSVPIDTQSIIIATDIGANVISLATCLRKVTVVTLSNIDSNDFNGNLPNGIQVYSSQFIPNVDDTSISLSTTFTSAYNASYPNNQPTTISFEGYIVGKLVTSVLGTMTDGKVTRVTKGTFITNVYKASEISVGGLALGPYTLSSCSQTVSNSTNGTSVSSSVGLSTTCCNSGAKMVYLASITSKGTTVPLTKSETSYTTCGLTLTSLTLPIIFSQSVHGVSNSSTAAYRFALGVTAAFNDHNDKGGVQSRRLALLSLDNSANATLHAEQLQYLTNKIPSIALLGEDNSDMKATRLASVPLIATRTGNIALRSPYNSSYINVRPSMVDKAAAAATLFVKNLGFSDYAPVYQSDDSYHTQSHEHFCNYAYQVLDGYCKKTFGFTSSNIDAVAQAIVQSSMRGIAIFANQRDSVYIATKLLTLSTTINVAIVHDDLDSVSSFSKLYGGRLFVVQSFPFLDIDVVGAAMVSGSATLPNNATLPVYFETFINSMNSSGNLKYSDSSSLEGYLVGRFIISALVNTINTITSKSVLASIYQQSLFSIEGFELGPIGLDCASSSSPYCGCNQMMHSVTVAQMGVPVGTNDQGVTVYGASDVPTYRFTFPTCGVTFPVYTFPAVYIAVIIGCVVVMLLVVLIIIGIIAWRIRVHVAQMYAPKSGLMVLGFTDVQNSTKLWAKKPTEMKAALKIHNAVMRKLIREYRGYEVKTNGDSFMVCFSDCMDAVNWACQVQRELLESKWPGDILDAFDCRVEWNKDKHLLYRGLRIRIGLHFGEAERVHDTVTRRMDYFGNTVNTAARVESEAKGGQVFISEALFMRVKQFLEDFSKYAPKPEEVVQTMVSVPIVAGLDAPVVQLEAPPPIEIAPASPTVEKDPVRRFSESLSPIDEGAALVEQPLPIAKGLEKYREGAIPQRRPSPLLPKLDLDDADEDTILYKFAGSYQLKGIQGKTNLYEVVPYPLRERKYDDTKKEEEEEKAALSARSGKSSGRSKGSGRVSSPMRMLSPAMASFNKRNKVQPK